MIRLDIQPYCSNCCNFEPDVTRPEKIECDFDYGKYTITDTIVRCKFAKRCENIKKYLERQLSNNS